MVEKAKPIEPFFSAAAINSAKSKKTPRKFHAGKLTGTIMAWELGFPGPKNPQGAPEIPKPQLSSEAR